MAERFRTEEKKLNAQANTENSEREEENVDPRAMTLLDHLGELRTRLVRSILGIAIFFGLTIFFGEEVIDILKQPLVQALPRGSDALHFTDPFDIFLVYIKIGVLGGLVLGSPVWLYQFWRFVEPALYPTERKYVVPFSIASAILFISGVSFCFFLVLPMAMDYLITLGGEQVKPIIAIGPYFSMLILMVFGFGLVFEAPLVLVLLGLLDLVSVETLRKNRRITIVVIFIVAAIATPPDPISQTALAIPMYVMFEISIVIIALLKRKSSEAEVKA